VRSAAARALAFYYTIGLATSLLTYAALALQPELRIQGRLLLGALPFTTVLLWGLDRLLQRLPWSRALRPALFIGGVTFMLAGNLLMMRML